MKKPSDLLLKSSSQNEAAGSNSNGGGPKMGQNKLGPNSCEEEDDGEVVVYHPKYSFGTLQVKLVATGVAVFFHR